jgi:hypothetical protein
MEPVDHNLLLEAHILSLEEQRARSHRLVEHKDWPGREAAPRADTAMQREDHRGSKQPAEVAVECAVRHKG